MDNQLPEQQTISAQPMQIPPGEPPVPPPPIPQPPKNRNFRFLIIGIIATFFLLLALASAAIFIAGQMRKPAPTSTQATSTPQPTFFEEEIQNPSRYATDSGVLKTQEDLNALDKELNNADLNENSLRPPDIQFDESF